MTLAPAQDPVKVAPAPHRIPIMRAFLLTFSLFLPLLATAGPAPYYQWQSKADGTVICRQTPPGHGWELLNGQPFRDLNCTQPAGRVERPSAVPGFRPQPGR